MAKTDSTSALQTSSQPETEDDEVVQIAMSKPVQFSIIGSFMILLLCAFYYAQNLLLPIVVAFLSALVLSPIVRTLKRSGIHESISAFLLVVLFAGIFGLTVYSLSGPISEWIEEAPRIGQELRTKLKTLRRPMEQIDAAQKQLEDATQGTTDPRVQEVAVREPGLLSKVAQGVPNIFAGAAVTFVLLLFLLASGDMFYEKLVRVLPTLTDRKRGLRIAYDIEREVSRYLLTITIINFALGAVIGAGLFVLGMPNPILWGLIAALLNFVPYIGAITGMAVVSIVAMVSFPTVGHALLAPAFYMFCSAIEGQFITPALVGRRLQINAIAVFLAIVFWGWIWGVIGVFVAVPMLIVVKVFCRHIESLSGLDEFLSARDNPVPDSDG